VAASQARLGWDVGQEAMVLRLANGGGRAKLLGEDVSRQALLLERLGAPNCMHRRRLAHDDRSVVLVHGDIALTLWGEANGCSAGTPPGVAEALGGYGVELVKAGQRRQRRSGRPGIGCAIDVLAFLPKS
jgi:hypothetical protein